MRKRFLYIILFLAALTARAQYPYYPYQEHPYNFVRYDLNYIQSPGDSSRLLRFLKKMDDLVTLGKGSLNIVHIGGSHVQADIHSGRFRDKLEHMLPGMSGPRGFVFPFKMAKTNSPSNYTVTYSGNWLACRNVQSSACELGLSGISVTTYDTLTEIRIDPNNRVQGYYDFNKLRIFHRIDSASFEIFPLSAMPARITTYPDKGYTEIEFSGYEKVADFQLRRSRPGQNFFTLYGVQFVNDDPGFSYHSIGVNGASVPSYLKCQKFTEHLSVLEPDLVILAIGVNDAHGSNFSKEVFMKNYGRLLDLIEQAAPGCAILFVTNNDTYFRKKYVNYNAGPVKDAMFQMAKERGLSVWDVFSIMGGFGSMATWQANGLAASDRIHFTGAGYKLIGDLMFEALIHRYTTYLQQTKP